MNERPYTLWPGWENLTGLAAVIAVSVAFLVLGSLIGGRRRFRAADLVVGWGAAGLFLTLAGLLTSLPLSSAAAVLGVIALAALVASLARGRPIGGEGQVKTVILLVPLLLIVAGGTLSHWDDFTHWAVNSSYLYRFDQFPGLGGPPTISNYPAYPHGMPIWTFLASLAGGHFIEPAGMIANYLLLAATAVVVITLIPVGEGRLARWAGAGLGLLLVIPLNPSFHRSSVTSSLADAPTAAVLAVAGVLGWRVLEALRTDDSATARALAWQLGFAGAALLNLRQANLVLLLLLLGAMAVLAWRDPLIRLRPVVVLAGILMAPAALFYGLWRWHVAAHLGSDAEFGILPFAQWHLGQIPEILGSVWRSHIKDHLHYFVPMAILSGRGLVGLLRAQTPFDRLAFLSAAVFLGYTGFLLFAYVAAFGEYEGVRAASFWRYSIHVGLLGLVAVVAGVVPCGARLVQAIPQPVVRPLRALVVVVVPALILALPSALYRTRHLELRALGHELADRLPRGARLAVIDSNGAGFLEAVLRYELWRPGRDDRDLRIGFKVSQSDLASGTDWWLRLNERPSITHTLVMPADATILSRFGVIPTAVSGAGGFSLLVRDGTGWQLDRLWPDHRSGLTASESLALPAGAR